jgi:hypothetical protein
MVFAIVAWDQIDPTWVIAAFTCATVKISFLLGVVSEPIASTTLSRHVDAAGLRSPK